MTLDRLKLSILIDGSLFDVEEVGDFGNDGAVGTTGKGVFLRVAEDVAQSIEVAALDDEMVAVFRADVHSEAARNAVFELLLYVHVVLIGQTLEQKLRRDIT